MQEGAVGRPAAPFLVAESQPAGRDRSKPPILRNSPTTRTLTNNIFINNTALSEGNKGLWFGLTLGELGTSPARLEYTYAKIDRDATVAAFNADAASFACTDYTATHSDWRLPNAKEMQSILDNNSVTNYTGAYTSPTLYTPVAPGWNVLEWVQRRLVVGDTDLDLFRQVG